MEPKRGEKAASAAKVRVSMKTNSTLYVNGPARAQFDFCVHITSNDPFVVVLHAHCPSESTF